MSGWEVREVRRWRFWPAWMPWGVRRTWTYVAGGDFIYED